MQLSFVRSKRAFGSSGSSENNIKLYVISCFKHLTMSLNIFSHDIHIIVYNAIQKRAIMEMCQIVEKYNNTFIIMTLQTICLVPSIAYTVYIV